MIVASIVEGEVSGDADRAKVARVIENRLAAKDGPTRGLLQMDSTVHYAVKKRGKAGTTDADRARARAPTTPTGCRDCPARSTTRERLDRRGGEPRRGPWLFFVTVNPSTGETRFASTVAEHQRQRQPVQPVVPGQRGQVLPSAERGPRLADRALALTAAAPCRLPGSGPGAVAVCRARGRRGGLPAVRGGLDETWRAQPHHAAEGGRLRGGRRCVAGGPRDRGHQHPGPPRHGGVGRPQHRRARTRGSTGRAEHGRTATVLGSGPRPARPSPPSPGSGCGTCGSRWSAPVRRRCGWRRTSAWTSSIELRRWAAAGGLGVSTLPAWSSTLPPGGSAAARPSPAAGALLDVVYADWPTPWRGRARPACASSPGWTCSSTRPPSRCA